MASKLLAMASNLIGVSAHAQPLTFAVSLITYPMLAFFMAAASAASLPASLRCAKLLT